MLGKSEIEIARKLMHIREKLQLLVFLGSVETLF